MFSETFSSLSGTIKKIRQNRYFVQFLCVYNIPKWKKKQYYLYYIQSLQKLIFSKLREYNRTNFRENYCVIKDCVIRFSMR